MVGVAVIWGTNGILGEMLPANNMFEKKKSGQITLTRESMVPHLFHNLIGQEWHVEKQLLFPSTLTRMIGLFLALAFWLNKCILEN